MNPIASLFSTAQARAIDQAAQRALDISEYALMQRAGAAAWRTLLEHWPQAQRVGIACGPGNNGGDGSVLARLARASGREVVLLCLPDGSPRSGSAAQAFDDWKSDGGEEAQFAGPLPTVDLWVDALFGIGLARAPEGVARALIEAINASGVDVLSLDCPSGVDADTGNVPGAAIHATRTLSFLIDKRGLHTGAALDCVGSLDVNALEIPQQCVLAQQMAAQLATTSMLVAALPPRRQDSNKGLYGHVLCVGGDHGSGGAIALTAEAALRCGAGLVSVATRIDHVGMLLARRPELMARGVEDSADFDALCKRASVIAIGPGLGTGEWGRALLVATLDTGKPLVIDADALNLLPEMLREKPSRTLDACVLTPHPGEAARLLECSAAQVQENRFDACAALVDRYRCCVVLKGAGTIVGAPDRVPMVIAAGNPGMASGGMGDTLTGVVAAMRAQQLSPLDGAAIGALLHGLAGDVAANEAGERGLLASDLFGPLHRLANP